jgi:hypothetical protein
MKQLLLLLLLLLILLFCLNKKSTFQKPSNNILIMACHIKKQFGNEVVLNNLKQVLNRTFKLVIIVYSVENGAVFKENLDIGVPVVYIKDTENIFYDFYKYKLAYDYIKKNNISFDWVFVMNDSIIITKNVNTIVNNIINSNEDYIGILESNNHIFENNPRKYHYQSWWLNFRPNAFDYWYNRINFNNSHSLKGYDHYNDITIGVKNIINDFEINLSNDMINKFKSKAIYGNTQANLFWDDKLYNSFYSNGFYFMKIKRIKENILPSNLKHLFKSPHSS